MEPRRAFMAFGLAIGFGAALVSYSCSFPNFDFSFRPDPPYNGPWQDGAVCRNAMDAACSFCEQCTALRQLCCVCLTLGAPERASCEPDGLFGCPLLCSNACKSAAECPYEVGFIPICDQGVCRSERIDAGPVDADAAPEVVDGSLDGQADADVADSEPFDALLD